LHGQSGSDDSRDLYHQGSGLKVIFEEHQVNALIYIMEDKADGILCSFGLTEDEKKVYNTVRAKFYNYFEPQQNLIFKDTKFNQQIFITDLYCFAGQCVYGDLRNEIIRGDIVIGLLEDALSKKLQLNSKLTSTITIAPQEVLTEEKIC